MSLLLEFLQCPFSFEVKFLAFKNMLGNFYLNRPFSLQVGTTILAVGLIFQWFDL